MSSNYTSDLAESLEKIGSRVDIARDIKKELGNRVCALHYLGGVDQSTPFENLLRKEKIFFIRYEQEKCGIPHGYSKISASNWHKGNILTDSYGFFINENFFKSNLVKELDHVINYFWLDFCGMPTHRLLSDLKTHVLDSICRQNQFGICYVTFSLNHRSHTDVRKILCGRDTTISGKAAFLCSFLNRKYCTGNIKCEVFHTYTNGRNQMGIFKFRYINPTRITKRIQMQRIFGCTKVWIQPDLIEE